MTSVLIVEDEESLADPLAFLLRKEGFEATVVADGPSALAEFERSGADIVLLDLMLPGMSGTDVCKQLRARSSVPVIMVTARDSEIDKVVGLELGADDYVTKPYSARELIARIRAVLRRFGHAGGAAGGDAGRDEGPDGGVLVFGELEVDTDGMEVRRGGAPVALTPTEMRLLLEFSSAPGTVLSRDKLLERVWDYGWGGDTRVVDVHVQRLRTKIGQDRIETVRGFGYKLKG